MPEAAAAPAVVEKPPEPVKSPEDKLHERTAALLAKANEPEPEPEPEPTTAEVAMDAATLDKLTKASERERAQRQRAEKAEKERDAFKAEGGKDLELFREFKALWETDPVAAVAKFKAIEDPTAEMERVLKSWVTKDLKTADKLTPEEIAELKAETERNKKFREGQEAAAKREQDRTNAIGVSGTFRDAKDDKGAAVYPLASAPENAGEAAVVAVEKATKRIIDLGGPTLTPQLAKFIFDQAYAEIEANLRKQAEADDKTEDVTPIQRPRTVPRVGSPPPAAPKEYAKTPEGASEKLHDNARKLFDKRANLFK